MKLFTLKQTVVAAGAAVTLGLAALTFGGAQTPTYAQATDKPKDDRGAWQQRHQAYLEAVAKRLGVTADKLKDALSEGRKDLGLPDKGRRADGPGKQRGAEGRDSHRGSGLEAAANALNMSTDELRAQLASGKSLAEVARARGVEASKVSDALKKQMSEHLSARIDQMMNRTWGAGGAGRPGR